MLVLSNIRWCARKASEIPRLVVVVVVVVFVVVVSE